MDPFDRHKLPRPVLRPTGRPGDFDSEAVDCPQVLRFDDGWHMVYTGWNGRRYAIGLAVSDDLIHWTRLGALLHAGEPGEWDYGSAGGGWLHMADSHHPRGTVSPADSAPPGRWHLFYCGFPEVGYEVGPGKTGLATGEDLFALGKHPESPLMTPEPGDTWESGGLYKSAVYERDGSFWMLYNAKTRGEPWIEQIGLARSADLVHWRKHEGNPILTVGPEGAWDCRFASDPMLLQIDGVWHMFYYGFDGAHAQDGVAISVGGSWTDWRKHEGNPILRYGPPGSYDEVHAHKPFVLEHAGVFYHFYCCCGATAGGEGRERAIALATSQPTR